MSTRQGEGCRRAAPPLVQYIVGGRPLGDFLTAVMENNLMEAYGRADKESAAGMKELCAFLYSYAPNACHGNPERVQAWYEHKWQVLELVGRPT